MKGYYSEDYYYGYIPFLGYQKFATEADYEEAYEEMVKYL